MHKTNILSEGTVQTTIWQATNRPTHKQTDIQTDRQTNRFPGLIAFCKQIYEGRKNEKRKIQPNKTKLTKHTNRQSIEQTKIQTFEETHIIINNCDAINKEGRNDGTKQTDRNQQLTTQLTTTRTAIKLGSFSL